MYRNTFYTAIAILLMILVGCDGNESVPVIYQNVSEITVPDGFKVEQYESGLNLPTSIAFPPDGSDRLFVNELQSGRIRIIEDGNLLSEPFAELETNVTGGFPVDGENGLIGITFDPDYTINRYLYVTYAVRTDTGTFGRVVRFTDDNNKGIDQTILLDGLPSAPGHQIESLAFGPDDKLYVSIGDAFQEGEVQDPQTFNGKIIRLNKDGSIPDDNPFQGSYTYAYGFRNCFDLVFRDNGDLLTTENGTDQKDEFNVVMKGENYGWPNVLGISNDPQYVDPIHVWQNIVAPTGMLFYEGNQFPDPYRNKLYIVLFGHTDPDHHDENTKRIKMVTLNGEGLNTEPVIEDFAVYTDQIDGNPIDITVGPDGFMYFNDFFQGKVYRIRPE